MMRATLRAIPVLACALIVLSAVPAFAQEEIERLLGRPIAAIELRVEGRPETSPILLALIDIKPGDRLTVEAWRRVREKLDRVPRFEAVDVKAVERPEGLALVFDATPKHPVDSLKVSFTDTPAVLPSEVERRIRDEFNGLPALTRTVDVENAVERIMRDEGYRSADATATPVPRHNPDRSTLEISVTAGPRTTVTDAVIRGQSPLDPARTLARLGVTPGSPFRAGALETELAKIRDELRAQKHYAAIAQPQDPEYTPDGTGVSLTITIDQGPVVELIVNGPLPGRFDDYIPVKVENSVDRDLLEESKARIVAGWQRQGYWRASASYISEKPTPDQQKITFTIDRGKRYRVLRVDLPKDDPLIVLSDFEPLKALKPNVLFDRAAVLNELGYVRGKFQDRGYHMARLRPEFEEVVLPNSAEGGVIIHPNIDEGPKATVTRIDFDLGAQPKVTEAQLREHMATKEHQLYALRNQVSDERTVPELYDSLGFLERELKIEAVPSSDGTEVVFKVRVREGPQILVNEILVVGNEKISIDTIMREVTLEVGQAYNETKRMASQTALYKLRVFKSVKVFADERLLGETSVRVVIAVEENATKTYEVGGGVEAGSYPRTLPEGGIEDRVIVAPRASLGFARSNIGGRDRVFTAFGRISFKPKTGSESGALFPDYRAIGTYRERYAFGLKSDLLLSATAEQGLRTSYNFIKRSTSAEFLRPLTNKVNVSGRYTLEWSKQFDEILDDKEQLGIDRLYPQVRISMFSGGIAWDRRDDALQATHGGLYAFNTDLALKAFGSEVSFIKSFGEASWFRPLIGPKRLIFAVRGQVGLARGFDPSNPLEDLTGDPFRDLPASQRFFTGGSATHRAYQLDRLGVDEIMTEDGLSKGGNGLLLLNVELRAFAGKLAKRDLTAVGFLDYGNVFHRVSEMNFSELRPGLGFGIRYDSWVGPLRLDFGFKTDRRTFTAGPERRWEFHLSIGEVF